MAIHDIPLFSMLRGKLGYLSQRQNVVAENVANASTPGFTPKDLKPFTVDKPSAAQGPVATHAGHITPGAVGGSRTWTSRAAPDSETTLDGNQVVLEEQMLKMAEARMDYDAAIGFYQKSLNMIRLAAKPPGRG